MAENTNTIWNLMISPESIHTASGQIDEIVSTIMNTYNAINEEIGVILQSWSGIAQDRHVKMFNEDAVVYNKYIDDMQYEAFRLFTPWQECVRERSVYRKRNTSGDRIAITPFRSFREEIKNESYRSHHEGYASEHCR